jgi:regulator of replication initiation timing
MAKVAHAVELDVIDRLEEKIKMLVGVVTRLRAEQSRMVEDSLRVNRELEAARARLTECEGRTTEVSALVQEREVIRSRVTDMLKQLEGLNL